MRVEKDQDFGQRMSLLWAFLRTKRGQELDCIKASVVLREEWGIYEDWHELATALDMMNNIGEAKIVVPGGFTIYKILDAPAPR